MTTLFIVFILCFIVYYYYTSTENLTNTNIDITNKIKNFITPNTTFIEYINFLKENDNRSYNLITQDTFFELKFLSKQNKLTNEVITGYI